MKHRVRRNQLVIAGLAIMIAAAGYLNYSGKLLGGKNQSKETSSDLANMELLDISEEDLSAANGILRAMIMRKMVPWMERRVKRF